VIIDSVPSLLARLGANLQNDWVTGKGDRL
jgi:hypothetical protein